LRDESEVKQEEFDKWVDVVSRKYLKENCGERSDEEYDEMIKVIKKYCDEKGCNPHDVIIDDFNEWVENSEMQMLESVKKFFSKNVVDDVVDEQHIEYRKHPKSPLDGCTLAEFKKVVKVVPASDDDDDDDDDDKNDDDEPPYEELKAYLKTMNRTERKIPQV